MHQRMLIFTDHDLSTGPRPKNRDIFLWILLLVLPLFLGADSPDRLRELETRLGKSTGAARVDVLSELSLYYIRRDTQKSITYGNQAIALAKALNYRKGEANASNAFSKTFMTTGDVERAKQYADRALQISQELNDKKLMADSLVNVGWYQWHIGDKEEAIRYGEEAVKLYEACHDKRGMAGALNGLGGNLYSLGQFTLSLHYHLRSLEIYRELNDQAGISRSLSNIGLIYEALNQNDLALKNYFDSLALKEKLGDDLGRANIYDNIGAVYSKLHDYDRAMAFLQNAVKLLQKLGNKQGITASLQKIGMIHLAKAEYTLALDIFEQTLKTNEEIGLIPGVSLSMRQIAMVLTHQGKYKEALSYLQRSLEIAVKVHNDAYVMDTHKALSDLYLAMGQYKKALESYIQFHEKSAQLLNEKISQQINDMQVNYEILQKEKRIVQLTKDNQIKGLTRNLYLAAFALVTIVLLLLFQKYLYFFAFWKKERNIGRYRLLGQIGSGGMSVIYKAHSIQNKSEKVAVKILKEEFSRDDSTVQRFRRESVIIDKFDHPNIVRVLERGEDKNRLYIVMEYLEGKTLWQTISEQRPLALPTCLHVMDQLADALAHIHYRKVVHRDLKPSNVVLLSRDGDPYFVKLLDFGLARIDIRSTLTKTGELLGTIGYMSPEQLLDRDFTTASDVYSLGVIFYETVCGRRAFLAENEVQMIRQILDEPPDPPSSIRPEIPVELNLQILKMMEKEPAKRPSLDEFRAWLARISEELS